VKASSSETSVVSLNYDGTIRKTWKAEIVKLDPPLIELRGVFDRDITHPSLGQIDKGTLTTEYFWLERWYNIFRFEEPSGGLKYFYCNIAMPVDFANQTLSYVDLDIDVVVWPDRPFEVLDEADFAVSAERYSYTDELVGRVKTALNELLGNLRRGEFPFNELL
jgi:protein associated with RNAse G/E